MNYTTTRRIVVLASIGLVLMGCPHVLGQDTSTPQERARWVEIVQQLETSPLDGNVDKDGEWVLKRISEAHDIHVPLCPTLLSDFNGMKYMYSHAITRQFMLASAAFLIENPDKVNDRKAMNLAALESVLKTYGAILQQKPDAKAKTLDELLQKQKLSKLAAYVQKRCQ